MTEGAHLSRRAKTEQDKYEALYRHRGQDAFDVNHGETSFPYLRKLYGPAEVLDLGAGSGAYARLWADVGVPVTAVDISREAFKHPNYDHPLIRPICRSLDNLAGIEPHQAVTSFDCLEHLHPKMVPDALKEIRRVTGIVAMLNICYGPSQERGPNGEELHLTVKREEWWIEKLKKAGFRKVMIEGDYLVCKP